MRISQTLGAVQPTLFELESQRHRKLKRFAKDKGKTINELLREQLVGWIDGLQIDDDAEVRA